MSHPQGTVRHGALDGHGKAQSQEDVENRQELEFGGSEFKIET